MACEANEARMRGRKPRYLRLSRKALLRNGEDSLKELEPPRPASLSCHRTGVLALALPNKGLKLVQIPPLRKTKGGICTTTCLPLGREKAA